jgi:hypothetical protein
MTHILVNLILYIVYRVTVIDILLKVIGLGRGVHVQPPINNH